MKASDALAKFLVSREVNTCFELVGGMITHMLDSLAESGQFSIVSMHHEQSAAFAAEAVARYHRGKNVAVAMGTSGPGATNLITGIASCWFDSVPCLFITGQVNTHELKGERAVRQQGFQELDIVEVASSLTKFSTRVSSPEDLMPALHKALSTALSGRQGPVLLDIPNDVQRANIPDDLVNKWLDKPLDLSAEPTVQERDLKLLDELCSQSEHPLLCMGGGARWSDCMDNWLLSAEECFVPYVSTLMGHERVVARDHYFNMIGTYGNREANWAVQNCDLLIVIGARLDVRQTGANVNDFARNAKVVQVDIDPGQLNNRVSAELSICSTSDSFFNSFPITETTFPKLSASWITSLARNRELATVNEYSDWKISPSQFFKQLNAVFCDVPVDFICDVGNHQMWAAQNLRLSHDQAVHYSGGLGAMGFALPVAVGIAFESGRKAVVISGDGSLQINIQELDTVNRLGLDVVIFVMNNNSLGMVKSFQDMYFDGRNQSTKKGYSSPDFVAIAKAYGIAAVRVTDEAELKDVLSQLPECKGPLLIDLIMDEAFETRPRLAFGSKLDNQYPEQDFN